MYYIIVVIYYIPFYFYEKLNKHARTQYAQLYIQFFLNVYKQLKKFK